MGPFLHQQLALVEASTLLSVILVLNVFNQELFAGHILQWPEFECDGLL